MSTLGRKLKYSINPDLIDRNEGGDNRLYTRGWVNTEGTAADLARTVKSGVAYCAQLSGPRKSANFSACDIASVDIDGSMTIGEALAHPLLAQHATMIYTTVRHTAQKHRFRPVFALARTITSPREMEALTRSLSRRLSGDQASTDATRLFFGNRAAEIELFDREMSEEVIEELIAQSWNPPVSSGVSGADRLGTIRSRHTVSPDLAIDVADGRRLPFCDVAIRTSIRCPFHNDADPSAFVVQSRSGTKGIHCSACHETFWSGGEDDHDFEDFDRAARKARERFDAGEEQIVATAAEAERDYGPLSPVIALPYYRKKLIACGIDIVTGTPAPPDLRPGLNFIKGAKGTGKTEALKAFSRSAESVLLVSHRRSLIRTSCKRLGLACYLSNADASPTRASWQSSWEEGRSSTSASELRNRQKRYGVCLDSLLQIPPDRDYDLIVFDEVEQLLAHFLGATLEHRGGGLRDRLFQHVSHLVRKTKVVVALDADLGWPSFQTLTTMRPGPARLWINDAKPSAGKRLQLFQSKAQLVAELKQAMADGKRCFVVSNSRGDIEKLAEAISREFPDLKLIVITSTTQHEDEVKRFMADPVAGSARHDVIFTSPSLGTGVDITFPENAEVVDVVVGFCESGITTHLDFDQQLSRVRHPGELKVWISPRQAHFETNADVVKSDLLHQSFFKNLLKEYDPAGKPVFIDDDPFIEMAALIQSRELASKNDLRGHFIRHMLNQGFIVERVTHDDMKGSGQSLLALGGQLRDAALVDRLLAATSIRPDEFSRVKERLEGDAPVSDSEKWALERTRLELFYRQKLTRGLIERDARGALRRRFHKFREVIVLDEYFDVLSDGHEAFGHRQRFVRTEGASAMAALRLIRLTPLWKNGEFDQDAVIDSSHLGAFSEFAAANRSALENLLDLEIRSDVSRKPVQQLNAVLGLMGLRVVKVGTTRSHEQKIYRYRLDRTALRSMLKIKRDRERTSGWQFVCGQYGWEIDGAGSRASGDDEEDDT